MLLLFVLEKLAAMRLGQNVIGIVPGIITALLIANVRATWLAAQLVWVRTEPPPVPLAATFLERFANVFPILAWPYLQWIFWLLGTPLLLAMAVGAFFLS